MPGFLAFARFGNFGNSGGFVPLGDASIFTAISLAMFVQSGIRVIPDYAEEVHSPGDLRRSIILAELGRTALYELFAVAFLASLNRTSLSLKVGPWADVTKIAGNPLLVIAQHGGSARLSAITAISAIVGPFITGYIYQGPAPASASPWAAPGSSARGSRRATSDTRRRSCRSW